ncbi:hypothetical protein [Sideroxyarcus sp. TK5]
MMATTHTWRFFRAGGFDQVQLDSGADLLALKELDQKLWVALSCPVHGIEFDGRTLEMIDTDGDGQVRANEVLAAIAWAGTLLKDADLLTRGADRLMLADINDTTAEGRQVLASARLILSALGMQDATHISLADLTDINNFVAGLQFNGDGVVCAKQVDDAGVRATVEDIVKTAGSLADASGEQGIDQAISDRFFAEAAAYADWYARGEADAGILPLGAGSDAAAQALQAVRGKVDDHFVRCQLAAYDARAAAPLSRAVEDYQHLAAQCLSVQNEEVEAFPLATVAAGEPLALQAGINPAWQDRIDALSQLVLLPLLGERKSLSIGEWRALCARFDAFSDWRKSNPAPQLDGLGIARVREILSSGQQERIDALIAQDKALAPEIEAVHSVERLIRYQRDLFKLVNNFVSFREFYSGRGKAVFQVGTLYLDGRSCELCVKVEDVNAHATFANSSGVCLVYCALVRKGGGEKMNIAAAFTAGDSDFLAVGRHGIFYDRNGDDWNATILRINDHPISIRQAFWSPYKKLSRTIAEQLQKFAATKAGKVQDVMGKTVAGSVEPAAKPAFDVAKFAGIFAAIGLAIGAIGGILASVVGGILSLKFWQIPLAVLGLMLAISLPSMTLAWLKLKKRNLGPILDACGWAINARALINIPFGTSLTGLPRLPEGAQRALFDPYAEQRHAWPYLLGLFLLTAMLAWAWYAGYFE